MVVGRLMEECPKCGYNPTEGQCQVSGCEEPAMWEGWYRVTDGFNIPTGMIQRVCVCDQHISVTIGGQQGAKNPQP